MKQIITLSAVVAVLAIASSGCFNMNSPTGPSEIATVSFPGNANDGAELFAQPAAPSDLQATLMGDRVKLNWKYRTDSYWFRVYVARDAGGFELFRATQSPECTASLGGGWTKLIFKVTALNAQGIESGDSNPVVIYSSGHDEPEADMPEDDPLN
jgi:hypothetical protein